MNEITSVSVLIPCYNSSKHIQRVIEAVQRQTRPAQEVIVVDDASTDDSAAIVERMNVKLIRHSKNRGPAAARNTAFSASSGEVVIFVDADAYADAGMIENLIAVYEQDPDIESLGGVGGRGIEAFTEGVPNQWRSLHAKQDFGDQPKMNVEYLFGLCCSYTRRAFARVNGFDEFFRINAAEDYDLGIRIRKAGFRLAYNPSAFIYHQHYDTIESLKRVQRNWTYWGFIARKRNQTPLIKAYLGIFRHLLADTFNDLLLRHNLNLALINMNMFFIKIKAIFDSRRVKNGR